MISPVVKADPVVEFTKETLVPSGILHCSVPSDLGMLFIKLALSNKISLVAGLSAGILIDLEDSVIVDFMQSKRLILELVGKNCLSLERTGQMRQGGFQCPLLASRRP